MGLLDSWRAPACRATEYAAVAAPAPAGASSPPSPFRSRGASALLVVVACWLATYLWWPPRPYLDDPGGLGGRGACDVPTGKAQFPAYARANCSKLERAPGVRLAVAIPLVAPQQEALLASIQSWAHPLRRPSLHKGTSFDVRLFVSTTLGQLPSSVESQVRAAANAAGATSFQSIACTLSKHQDKYPLGTWVQLLLMLEAMHVAGYEAFLLCEPDVRVLRAGWVDALLSTLDTRERWWVRGSAYISKRGRFFRSASSPVWDHSTSHINGNALYRVEDARFVQFVYLALGAGKTSWVQTDGFDQTFAIALEALRACVAHRWIVSLFACSSIIINLSLGPCMTDAELRSAFPDAYLTHYNPHRCAAEFNTAAYVSAVQRSQGLHGGEVAADSSGSAGSGDVVDERGHAHVMSATHPLPHHSARDHLAF